MFDCFHKSSMNVYKMYITELDFYLVALISCLEAAASPTCFTCRGSQQCIGNGIFILWESVPSVGTLFRDARLMSQAADWPVLWDSLR